MIIYSWSHTNMVKHAKWQQEDTPPPPQCIMTKTSGEVGAS